MCEAGASRFREPKTAEEEQTVVYKAIPASTKYRNKWATSILNEWQTTRTFQVAVLEGSEWGLVFCVICL